MSSLFHFLSRLWSWIVRGKEVLVRGLLCWFIGIGVLFLGDTSTHDFRYRIRPVQPITSNVVYVDITQRDWLSVSESSRQIFQPLQEMVTVTDRFFWNQQIWSRLLTQILEESPQVIGVTFFFGENIRPISRPSQLPPVFDHEKIVWGASLDSEGRVLQPVFSSHYNYNVGLIRIPKDDDGIVRRIESPLLQIPHLAIRLANRAREGRSEGPLLPEGHDLINYRGPTGTFPRVRLSQVLAGTYPKDYFKDKVVIIGSSDARNQIYQTPLGAMSRAEIVANMVDTIYKGRWTSHLDRFPAAIYLLLILTVGIWLMSSYPQSIAFAFIFWVGTGLSALSLWIFDTFNFWTPILSPLALLTSTYIVFLGYQLTKKENLTWRLEQEKKYLYEVEQLKNNFVSLISHDLKTPIAKIQAICDRLLNQYPQETFTGDVTALRRESSELHRYIQSILQIIRVESSDFKINKESSDINELIEEAVDQVRPLASAKSISVDLSLEPMFLIELDSVLIREVIINLIENGIKYSPEGSRIQISSKEVNDQVIVAVEDNGPGISEDNQKKIFEKFFRSPEQELNTKGSGLGLYLVKYFVELHRGKVFLKSELNAGTVVGFTLPIGEEPQVENSRGESS